MTDRPKPPQPPAGGAPAPLTFTLNQAAALCGIPPHKLCEWTDCGFVRATGSGDGRRYDREALRQILAVRNAVREARRTRVLGSRDNSIARSGHRECEGYAGQVGEDGRCGPEPGKGHPDRYGLPTRPEEFAVPMLPMDDTHLTLQTEMFFALNAGAPHTAEQIARHFGVDVCQMLRVLDELLQAGSLTNTRYNGELYFFPYCARLHGPNPREQRIRATRRTRIPSSPNR